MDSKKVNTITVGRTINLGNFQNEKIEVNVNVFDDDIKAAYEMADNILVNLTPKWGKLQPDYIEHVNANRAKRVATPPEGAKSNDISLDY